MTYMLVVVWRWSAIKRRGWMDESPRAIMIYMLVVVVERSAIKRRG